jgi:hypothetical protein
MREYKRRRIGQKNKVASYIPPFLPSSSLGEKVKKAEAKIVTGSNRVTVPKV